MGIFVQRAIDVTINLGIGQFGDQKGADVTLSGYRVQAAIQQFVGETQGQLQLRIFGLTLDMINQLTTIGPIMTERRNNSILVTAGDLGGAMSVAYQGQISAAWADFNGMPEVPLNIVALGAAIHAVRPVNALSFRGAVDVAQIMAGLAQTMGISFENHGVQIKLNSPYFPGTAYDQVCACARQAGINFTIDRGVLAIWPSNGVRGSTPVKLSSATGMVGYPSFSGDGVLVTHEYLPNVDLGNQIDIDSTLQVASGSWNTMRVVHELHAKTPGGSWFTQLTCIRPPQ